MVTERLENRPQAATITAQRVASALERRMDGSGQAAVLMGGGRTPQDALRRLSGVPLDWSRVSVVPSDEPWGGEEHPDSNEIVIRRTLLRGPGAAAGFVPLYRPDADPEAACAMVHQHLAQLPRPYSCTLISVREDGSFASLFPGYDGLDLALNPEFDRWCVPVSSSHEPGSRLSLTLSPLTDSDEVILLAFGDDKWDVLQRAVDGDDSLPLTALVRQTRAPVRAIWAP